MSRLPKRYDFPLNGSHHSIFFFPFPFYNQPVLSHVYDSFFEREKYTRQKPTVIDFLLVFLCQNNNKPSDT